LAVGGAFGTGRRAWWAAAPPRPLTAVSNVTVHPSTASGNRPVTYILTKLMLSSN